MVVSPQDRKEAYDIRTRVFVDEQKVPVEEELDAYDEDAAHFLIESPGPNAPHAIATARLIDKGHGVAKIGRVAVLADYRGRGLGAMLMRYVEDYACERGFIRLVLDAQIKALAFYARLGYVAEGEVFLDAGIEHRFMSKTLPNEPTGT